MNTKRLTVIGEMDERQERGSIYEADRDENQKYVMNGDRDNSFLVKKEPSESKSANVSPGNSPLMKKSNLT